MRLKHDHILPFIGVCESAVPGKLSMLSPWMCNGSIVSYMALNPDYDVYRAVLDIADGLRFLHSHEARIIHGDIKGVSPCNILDSKFPSHVFRIMY
jgi:serine/threonine protein kinase